jgi:hypothetical protein
MLYRETPAGFVPWRGEAIDDIRYPLNIEAQWTEEALARIGLMRPVESDIPAGRQVTARRVARVGKRLEWVYETEEALPAEQSRRSSEERLAALESGLGRVNDELATLKDGLFRVEQRAKPAD